VADVDADIGMDFTGKSSMPAVIREVQHDYFEEEVIIEEWVFFDDGEENNSRDAGGLVCEMTGSCVSGLSGLEVSEIALDASNAMCVSLEETSIEDLAETVSVLETIREIWCKNIMQREVWVFDPGMNEFSSCSNCSTGIACLADMRASETQLVSSRSQTGTKCVSRRAVGEDEDLQIRPSAHDPPWVEASNGLESLIAMSVGWNTLRPECFEGRLIQATSEGKALLSVWGVDQGVENESIAVSLTVASNTALHKGRPELSAMTLNIIGENRVDDPSLKEGTVLVGRESWTAESEATLMDVKEAGSIPGTILWLRGGCTKPRKRTKKGMRPLGKRQRLSKDAGYTTVAIATPSCPVDVNFESLCLLGKADLVKDRKNDFNRVLAGMNIDLDWAMFEQTRRETLLAEASREANQLTKFRGSSVREVSNLYRAAFLAMHPDATLSHVLD